MTTPPLHNNSISQSFSGKMKHASLLFFCALFLAFASGCKKEESNIGANLAPDSDKLNVFTYDVPLQAKTIVEDTLASSKLSSIVLGSFYHPIFGRASASLASEFKLENTIDFGANPRIDSVVLSMNYQSNSYMPYGDVGKLGGVQKFKVYELTETLSDDSTYYSGHNAVYGNLLGQKTFRPDYVNTINYVRGADTIAEPVQVRIKLDTTRFKQLVTDGAFGNIDNFYNYFKGLYITPDNESFQNSGQGAALLLSAADRNTRIRIFYRNDANIGSTTRPYEYADIVVLSGTRRYQVYKHNYNGTEVATNIAMGTNTQRLYVQGLAGVKTKVILPNFDTIADFAGQHTYVVNLAELVIPVEESTINNSFPVIPTMAVAAPSTDSKYSGVENPPSVAIDDAVKIPSQFFGGTYDKDKKEYVFRISLHMTNILNKTIANNGLYLVGVSAIFYPHGVVISNTADRKIHLRITYTKI